MKLKHYIYMLLVTALPVLCGCNNELHHYKRTDGDDHIELLARRKHFLKRNGYVSVLTV